MALSEPEKIEVICPECKAKNEILYFASNKTKMEKPGSRAGHYIEWTGRGEKIQGQCEKCKYKFKLDDL